MKTKTLIAGALLATVCAASADITSVANLGIGAADVNLTTEGTTDWVMLGQGASTTARDEKAGVSYIGDVTVTGTHTTWSGSPHDFTWTDGAPTAAATAAGGNWEAKPLTDLPVTDQGLSFSVNGLAVGDYTMKLYTASYKAEQLLTATIGTSSMSAGQASGNDATSYSVAFSIDTLGDVLDIAFNRNDAVDNADANVSISAITIAAIPEPATFGLIGVFGGGLLFFRRRFMI